MALEWLWSWPLQIGAIGLSLAHPVLRWSNEQLGRDRKRPDNVGSFLRDQLVRLAVVFGAAILLADSGSRQVVAWVAVLRSRQDKLLSLLAVYTAVVFGGGALIRRATKSLLANVPNESPEQLRNAGMYIGWLERFLILTALLLQSPSMAGLILTAKSIVRYPELKSLRFAEYFLIGTLLSIGLALVGGIILIKVFHGSFALAR